MADLGAALHAFNKAKKFGRKGPLCVALVTTQHARKMGLPLDPGDLLTDKGGQVLGLGKAAVQAVLKPVEDLARSGSRRTVKDRALDDLDLEFQCREVRTHATCMMQARPCASSMVPSKRLLIWRDRRCSG